MLTWDIKILTGSQGFKEEFKQGGFSFVFTSELEELPSQTMKRDKPKFNQMHNPLR